MAEKAIISTSTLNSIGRAIMAKGGSSVPMLPKEMPAAIRAIPSGSSEGCVRHAEFAHIDPNTVTIYELASILKGTTNT